jgi:8-oxo-dGTP diphosphatase
MTAPTTSHLTPVSLAGAVIEHPNLGLLLQLRDEDAPTYPHHWGLFGGHIEADEDPEFAIWRELEEELQLTRQMVTSWRLGLDFPHPSGGHVYAFYITTEATLEDFVLGEGEAMHYAKIAEIDPSQPYQGHAFTAVSAQILQAFLDARVAHQNISQNNSQNEL